MFTATLMMKDKLICFLNKAGESVKQIQSLENNINDDKENTSSVQEATPVQNTETDSSQDITNVIDNSVDVQVQGDNNNVTINQYINTDK